MQKNATKLLAVVLTLFLLFSASCSRESEISKRIAYMHKDERVQHAVIEELKNEQVPHQVDKNGFIIYETKYEVNVRKAIQEAERRFPVDGGSMILMEGVDASFFISTLEDKGVVFSEGNHQEGWVKISWEAKYKKEADEAKLIFYKRKGGNSKISKIVFKSMLVRDILIGLLEKEGVPYRLRKEPTAKAIGGIDDVIEYEWAFHYVIAGLHVKAMSKARQIESAK